MKLVLINHNTKLKRECFNTLNFDGVSEAIRVSSERAFVDSLSLTNDRYETVIIMQFCSNEIHFLCSDDCASCTDCYLSCAHDCVQEAPIHQGYVSQDHSPHVCRLLHAGCDLIPLCKLAEQRFKIYWTGTSEWMHLSDKHKHIPPHWLHIGLWAHLVNAGKCEALITLHHFSNQSRFHCDNKKSVTESTLHALGSLSDSVTVFSSLSVASAVRAISLLSAEIWPDDPVLRLAAQVQDDSHNVQTLPTTITVKAVSSSLSMEVEGSCSPDSTSGSCIAGVQIPSGWFQSGETLSVQYGLPAQSLTTSMWR